jgi:hypothetical protein
LMGTRFANWPEDRRNGMAAFFSRVAYKSTDEWKEEIVYLDLEAIDPLEAVFPDGTKARIEPGADPRVTFADWLIAPDNPWFTRNTVNRVWAWLLGRGIIHEPDDIRPDNPPAAEALFAYYPVRRLDAEVLIDALDWVGGTGEDYTSPIPEPFTYIPEDQRSIALADGSITSTFLQMFGRPPRDTGLESERNNQTTDAQRLYLLNSTDVYRRIANSPRLRRAAIAAGGDRRELIRGVYMTLLSRDPTPAEQAAAEAYWQTPGSGSGAAPIDLAWALVNSMEFLYRH